MSGTAAMREVPVRDVVRRGDALPESGRGESRHWGKALGAALVAEVAAVAAAGWLLTRPAPPPVPPRDPVLLDLTQPVAAEPPRPGEPQPVKPAPPVEPPRPQPVPRPHRAELARPVTPLSRPPLPARPDPVIPPSPAAGDADSVAAPVVPPPPPVSAPMPPAGPAPDALDRFQTAARAAVQAALRYPNAARIRHLAGQCRLTFDYRDGKATRARLAGSSGYEVLDAAALAALEAADLPPPPQGLAGHLLELSITVVFQAQS